MNHPVLAILGIIAALWFIFAEPPWMHPVGKSGNHIELEKAAQTGHSPKQGGYREQDYTGALMSNERWEELRESHKERK
jgi:cobalamin biosynthesis protein CobD/CbiB